LLLELKARADGGAGVDDDADAQRQIDLLVKRVDVRGRLLVVKQGKVALLQVGNVMPMLVSDGEDEVTSLTPRWTMVGVSTFCASVAGAPGCWAPAVGAGGAAGAAGCCACADAKENAAASKKPINFLSIAPSF